MKTHWRLVCNYADAPDPEDNHWTEDCWLDITPQEVIDNFNDSLRPGEKERILLFALVLESSKDKPHTWYKSKPVTIVAKGLVYDEYTCSVCGAVGKRHGLESYVVPNRKNQINCKRL